MKNIALLSCLAIACLTTSCGEEHKPASTTATTTQDTFYLCDKLVERTAVSQEEFYRLPAQYPDTTEPNNLVNDSAMVKRQGDSLTFITSAGKNVALVSYRSDNPDSASAYHYRGYSKELGQYVVYGNFYEWDNYLLIDRQTGDTTVTIGLPVVSPDKKYFFCANYDLEAGFTFNGFELYENTHPAKLLCRRELADWGADTVKWSNANTIFAAVKSLDTAHSSEWISSYYKLTLK